MNAKNGLQYVTRPPQGRTAK